MYKNAFITGITGNQGSAVAKYLLKNYSVTGLKRNANSEKAKQWKAQGVTFTVTVAGTPILQGRCPHRRARMLRLVTKKVENNLRKNEVNLPNHIHLLWQVDYTFSGGILTQAVFGGDTGHGGNTNVSDY